LNLLRGGHLRGEPMSDVLKDKELQRLLLEIAAITGEAPGPLLRRALNERLARLTAAQLDAEELREIAARHSSRPLAGDREPDWLPSYSEPGAQT
jgi:hypothetical protein